MIARFKVELSLKDFIEIVRFSKTSIFELENQFKQKFDFKHAFSYAYGRSALRFLIESTGIKNSEIILSSYTCSVVAHAVVLSGNRPVFVDINLETFNPEITSICNAINSKTRFIILSHTFGFAQDSRTMQHEIEKYQKEFGNKIWLINDCAHSFDAKNNNNRVMKYGDATILGLNISKTITSIFGGITATNNPSLAKKISIYNTQLSQSKSIQREIYQRLYTVFAYISFKKVPYRLTHFLINKTRILRRLTDSYHLDEIIHFPKDYKSGLTHFGAQIGIRQLRKYDKIMEKRVLNSQIYDSNLINSNLIRKPNLTSGSTFSHYPILVENKEQIRDEMRKKGVECGEVIQYAIPNLENYSKYTSDGYSSSLAASKSVINLPVNYSPEITQLICDKFNKVIATIEGTNE